MTRILVALFLALASSVSAHAAEVRVAVAANFAAPAREIALRFERNTGHRAVIVLGASGQLFSQIANGAPFDIFLSADAERPLNAEAYGLAAPGTRFTYASGRLVLWSRDPMRVDPDGQVLARGGFHKLAIADPRAAPYGLAAVETLKGLGLYARVRSRLVQGASVTQAYQFAATGAADLALVPMSLVVSERRGSRWLVPSNLHSPIDQQAVILRSGATNPAAIAFAAFLRSSDTRALIRRYGYEVR